MADTMNIISFDIEDWFHPEMFSGRFPRENWTELESRVRRDTDIILNFLSRKNVKATFFYLGWVAETFPELVKDTVSGGHEIASHSYSHSMITKMQPEEFRADLRRSLDVLNDLSDHPVVGFRAPTFSVTRDTLWALPIMFEEGIRYDSSVFPIHHDRYGIPDAPREPFVIYEKDGEELIEYPMTTVRYGSYNLPFGGGGYFRLYPYWMSLKLARKCRDEGRPIMFYAHPWEFDTELPEIELGMLSKLRHYKGIRSFLQRLDRMTDLFPFTSFREAGLPVNRELTVPLDATHQTS